MRMSSRKQRKTILNIALFVVALGALAWGGSQFFGRLGSINANTTRITNFDKSILGAYMDLLRSRDIDTPMSNDPSTVPFVVAKGESVQGIGQNLQKQGLIKDAELFRLYVRLNGLDATINAGNFTLRRNMSISEIASVLQRGTAAEVTVTIPEGKRIEEVAEILQKQVGINKDEFLRLARQPNFAYAFLKDLPNTASIEGYLFPDTYRLPINPSAQDALLRMLDNYEQKVAPLMAQAKLSGSLKTPRDVLAMASIVEREAVNAAERPTIASVYLNRLKIGMPLQADPTTQYALGFDPKKNTWWRTLTFEDYKYNDPAGYNTYVNPAMPPGPIASPGLSSIQAALNPANTEFYFFVAACNGSGVHQFSKTFAEHQSKLCN